jgi:hypothetical protein
VKYGQNAEGWRALSWGQRAKKTGRTLAARNCQGNLPRWPLVAGEVDPRSLKLVRSSLLTVDTLRPEDKTRGRLDLSHVTLLEDRENKQIILAYPRSYNAYKSNEWATVRLALR